jgi:hypothetical protein
MLFDDGITQGQLIFRLHVPRQVVFIDTIVLQDLGQLLEALFQCAGKRGDLYDRIVDTNFGLQFGPSLYQGTPGGVLVELGLSLLDACDQRLQVVACSILDSVELPDDGS